MIREDMVIHPTHYNQAGKKECWDEMEEIFNVDATIIFDCMSAYKYRYRKGNKDGNPEEQDKAKIDSYMSHAKGLIMKSAYVGSLALETYNKMSEILKKDSDNRVEESPYIGVWIDRSRV